MLDRKIANMFGRTKKQIVRIPDDKALKQINEAKLLIEKGAWDTVSLILKHLIEQYPDDPTINLLYGRLQANQTLFTKAIYHFKKCIKSKPDDGDCYFRCGAVLGCLNRCNEEEEMYKKCLLLTPNHHECHYNYGRLLEIKCQYKLAEEHFQKAIELDNKDINYYFGYSKLLKQLRRFDEAQKYINIAINIDKTNDRLYCFYAKLLDAMGKSDDALMYSKKAIKMNPLNRDYQRYHHGLVRKVGATKNSTNNTPLFKKAQTMSPLSSPSSVVVDTHTTPGLDELLNNKLPDPDDNIKTLKTRKTRTKVVKNIKKRAQSDIDLKFKFSSNSNSDNIKNKLMIIQDDNKDDQKDVRLSPPIVVADYSSNIFQKANEMYQNEKYKEAKQILNTLIMVDPNDQKALDLYEKVKDKLKNDFNNKPKIPPPMKKNPHLKVKNNKEQKDNDDNMDPCQSEFKSFLDDRVKMGHIYPDLYQRFEKEGYNDIRYVLDLDKEILKTEIKLKKLHINNFMRKIDVFKSEINAFQKWIKHIVSGNQQYSSMDGLIDKFENKGILTFESLYRYVLCKDDLVYIIGKEFHNVHRILWREIGHQQSELLQSVTSDIDPAFSTQKPADTDNDDDNDNSIVQDEGAQPNTQPALI